MLLYIAGSPTLTDKRSNINFSVMNLQYLEGLICQVLMLQSILIKINCLSGVCVSEHSLVTDIAEYTNGLQHCVDRLWHICTDSHRYDTRKNLKLSKVPRPCQFMMVKTEPGVEQTHIGIETFRQLRINLTILDIQLYRWESGCLGQQLWVILVPFLFSKCDYYSFENSWQFVIHCCYSLYRWI